MPRASAALTTAHHLKTLTPLIIKHIDMAQTSFLSAGANNMLI